MARRLLVIVLAAIAAVTAVPAQAGTATVTDLKLVHLTVGTAGTQSGAQKLVFRMVAKNGGPDTAADVTVTVTVLSNATIQPYNVATGLACKGLYGGGSRPEPLTACDNGTPIPAKGKMVANLMVRMTDESQPVTGTFCVSIDAREGPDQVDPVSANDCASVTYTP
jgi:hypothetical protein